MSPEMESQAHPADQVHRQDISKCLSVDSTGPEDIASGWTSPGDVFSDVIHLKFGGGRGAGSLEGISERRRAQNKVSQRAYRERRDRHVKGLEEQLERMVNRQEVMSKEHAKLRADHEKLLEGGERWKAKLIDEKEIIKSRATVMGRDQEEEREFFVKVMICRKECRNKEFSEGGKLRS